MPPAASRSAAAGRGYWALSRAPRYSLLFALPLLLLYEGLAAALSGPGTAGIRNGADVVLKDVFIAVAGRRGPLVFVFVLVAVCVWLVARDMRRSGGGLRPGVFALMLGEAAVLAALFGVVVGTITARLLSPFHALAIAPRRGMSGPTQFMVSLGAGLYEELLFRVILVSALLWLAERGLGWSRRASAIAATLVGAVVFSAAHYVGQLGDTFTVQSFVFRAVGGLAFSALYVTRGFGITAWTHALYDVFLMLA